MKLFDSHCHLDDKSYTNDIDDVITRAAEEDVRGIMLVGVTATSSKKVCNLAKQHTMCFSSVGIHPHDASGCSESILNDLIELTKNPVVKAWGETGLDFNRLFSPQDIQEKWFIKQIEIATALDLPLIFHERDSNGRFLELLHHHAPPNLKGVVHCFSGNREEMNAYLNMGLHIGITGILTIQKRGKLLRELAREIPDDRILIETDAPYLTPAPQKNKSRRNEPAFVKSTLIKLAEIKKVSPEALADTLWKTTVSFYGIDKNELA
jgi:TatD DNase family protein